MATIGYHNFFINKTIDKTLKNDGLTKSIQAISWNFKNFIAAFRDTIYNVSQIVCQCFSYSENLQFISSISFSICNLLTTILFNMELESIGIFLYLLQK